MCRFAFLIVLLVVSTASAGGSNFDFDQSEVGPAPPAFTVVTGAWNIRADTEAPSAPNVLVQAAQNEGSDFNVIVVEGTEYGDLDISVSFEALSGNEDQGGGPVWRYLDIKNYYIARYNPLEDNFRLYKVLDGHRKMLKSATIASSPGWHEIRVTMTGNRIRCFYDQKPAIEAEDDTFSAAGRVGLWTKADAVTAFDELKVLALGGGE